MSKKNLIHLAEPVFEYMCKVNRIARNGGQIDYHQLRGDLLDIFEDLDKEANKDSRLTNLYEQVKMPLIFFVDSTIIKSGINCAEDWEENRLAFDYGHLSGDEDFFDMMEELEADPSDEASECLAIYFTCIGLGFTGFYESNTDFLKKKMDKISSRIRKYIQSDPNAKISPECYEHTDQSDLVEPPGSKLMGILIAFAGLFIVVFVSILILFDQAVGDLNRAVNTVNSEAIETEEG